MLEVETPVLSHAAVPDVHLASFVTRYHGPQAECLYLHTSPEDPMKRLLAAGAGSIYQICKVFRDGEAGCLHNPEFTLLEWYRVGLSLDGLMDETVELINAVLDTQRAVERITYRAAFERHAGLNPHTADAATCKAAVAAHGIGSAPGLSDHPATALDLLMTHVIEPQLGRGGLTVLYDYPAHSAAMACVRPGEPALAERFEVYVEGIELANGYHELADAGEQRRRFVEQLRQRAARGLPEVPIDEPLLAALPRLPDCVGVALGLDRLLMLKLGAGRIADVLAFPIERA